MVGRARHVCDADIWLIFLRILRKVDASKWEDIKEVVGCVSGVAWRGLAFVVFVFVPVFVLKSRWLICVGYLLKCFPVMAI